MHQTFRAALIFGLLAVSSAATAQDVPAKAGSTPPDQPTILVTSVVPGVKSPEGNYSGAIVQFDLVNTDLQKSLAGQSTRLVIDIDCAGEKIRARNMIVYKEPKQGGAAAEVRIKDDWESYQGGAYLADVARSICRQDVTTKASLPQSPVASNRSESLGVERSAGKAAIQFVSSVSEAEVRADIAKLRSGLGAQISQKEISIQTAVVKGHTRYRGQINGFANKVEAAQFCSKITELHFQCMLIDLKK